MRTGMLRRIAKKSGLPGLLAVGLCLLVRPGSASRKIRAVTVVALSLVAIGVGLCLLDSLQTPHVQGSRRENAAPQEERFAFDYRLPTSAEGTSVGVVGFWQRQGDNLPHHSALWALDPFSGAVKTLYRGGLFTYQMAWQPGAKRIAFTGHNFHYAVQSESLPFWIADVSTGKKQEVFPASEHSYVSHFAWSPSGKWLACNRAPWPRHEGSEQERGVWIVSADGRQTKRLPVPAGVARWELVGWRPGSESLYVTEGYPYQGRPLWQCDLKGNISPLKAPATDPRLARLPKEGSCFALATRPDQGSKGSHAVCTYDTMGDLRLDLGSIDQTQDVQWRPDGQWLAMTERAQTGGIVTLRILRGDGSEQKRLSAGYGEGYQPTTLFWSPDCSRMLVRSEQYTLVDTEQGTGRRFENRYHPCAWRADNRLICEGGDRIVIVTEQGEVEKVFPPERFTGSR